MIPTGFEVKNLRCPVADNSGAEAALWPSARYRQQNSMIINCTDGYDVGDFRQRLHCIVGWPSISGRDNNKNGHLALSRSSKTTTEHVPAMLRLTPLQI